MEIFSFEQVFPDKEVDILQIQKVYEQTPSYFEIIKSQLPDKEAVKDDLNATPLGCSFDRKFFYAIYHNKEVIGCADIIQGYPNSETGFIGLLLFIESKQGLGYGTLALDYIVKLTQDWGCNCLRIAVVESNKRAQKFWSRQGFIELYRKRVNESRPPVIVMEKTLTQ